jgi:outer membrane receptor protein involved in Fe transport
MGSEFSYTAAFRDATLVREVGHDQRANVYLTCSLRNPKLRLSLAVQNVFDRPPPFADNVQGYASNLSDPLGRVLAISIRRDW